MINAIKLRHFKSHESTDLEFSEGTNLIIGQMGSGKTCIVEGLCFALFGTFPSIKSHRISLEDAIMARPTKYSEFSVEVKFDVAGKDYWVERIYKKGEATAYLRNSNSIIESGPQRVTETVGNLLNIDYELFIRAIYSEQNRLDWFFYLTKGERKRYFDDLLGISKFEIARSTANTTINQLKDEATKLNIFLTASNWNEESVTLNEIESKIKTVELHLEKNDKDLKDTLQSLQEANSKLNELENKRKDFSEKTSDLKSQQAMEGQLSSLINDLKEFDVENFDIPKIENEQKILTINIAEFKENLRDISVLEKTIERNLKLIEKIALNIEEFKDVEIKNESVMLAQIEESDKKVQEIQEAIKSQTSLLLTARQLSGKADAYSEQIKSINLELVKNKENYQKIKSSLVWPVDQLNNQLKDLNNNLSNLMGELSKNKQNIIALEKVDSICPICLKPLDKKNAEELLVFAKKRVNELEIKIKEFNKEIDLIKSNITNNTNLHSEMVLLENSINSQEVKLQKSQQEYSEIANKENLAKEIEKKIEQLQVSFNQFNKQKTNLLNSVNKIKQLSSLKTEEQNLIDENEANRNKLIKLKEKFTIEKLEKFEKKLSDLQHTKQVINHKLRKKEIERNILLLNEQIKRMNYKENELENQRSIQSDLVIKKSSYETEKRIKTIELENLTYQEKLLKKKRDEVESSVQRLKKVEATTANMQKILNSLIDTQTTLRSQLISSLNEASDALWKNIYPYGDYPTMRLIANESDYILELQAADGNWMAIESASGGERVCAALCLRVALALVLSPSMSLIILDEPTHNMDSMAVSMLSRALHDQLPKFVSQAFLITHDESLKESASSKIFVIERDKDSSDKSMVNLLSNL